MSENTLHEKKTSTLTHIWLWTGAAISVAEIMVGTLFAGLGLTQGILAIVIGHAIGFAFLYGAGYIGASTGLTAMNTAGLSFGKEGKKWFALLNVLQLVGWTAVMIVNGANAVNLLLGKEGTTWSIISCLVVGGLVLLWSYVRTGAREKINGWSVISLLLLCAVATYSVFTQPAQAAEQAEALPFGMAIELSLAMPLSWLPLIADYNREAEHPFEANLKGSLVYTFGSMWMYILGLGAAIYTGISDISLFLQQVGLGIVALLIVVLSTVTTTYLDVRSAAISFGAISTQFVERNVAALVAIVGIIIAMTVPVDLFEHFLYFIGSCFAPMVAILLVDFFFAHHNGSGRSFDRIGLMLWLVGFGLYRYLLDSELGNTIGVSLPVLFIVMLLTVGVRKITQKN